MEYLFDWVLPLWLASWLFILWQIYIPAIRLIRELDPEHIIYKWRVLTFLLFSIMSFVCVPVLLVAAMGENYRRQFIYNYVKNLMEKDDDER